MHSISNPQDSIFRSLSHPPPHYFINEPPPPGAALEQSLPYTFPHVIVKYIPGIFHLFFSFFLLFAPVFCIPTPPPPALASTVFPYLCDRERG